MKRLINNLGVMFTAMVLVLPFAHAQKTPFKGTIIYDITTQGEIPEMAKSMMPTVMTYRFSTEKQSMALNFPMAQQKTIFDPVAKTAKILMNVVGQKIVLTQTSTDIEQMRKQEGETIGVKETTETKTIAGFLCKKTVITKKTTDGKEKSSDIYFTEAIDASAFKVFNPFPEIKGFPLEFSMKSGPMEFKVMARTITKETPPASEFEVGSDYLPMSVGDLQKFFGNAGSLLGK